MLELTEKGDRQVHYDGVMICAYRSTAQQLASGIFGLLLLLAHQSAFAQTDQRLLQRAFGEEWHWADTTDEPTFIYGGHTKDGGGDDRDFDLFYWDSTGRIKLEKDNPDPNFWMGYRLLTMSIGGDQPALPDDLNDLALAGAFHLNHDPNGWQIDVAGGVGSANDGHWSNTDAIYGIGTINAAHKLNQNTTLHLGVSYHGNRTLWPDIPLPYVSIFCEPCDRLSCDIGLLSSSVTWKIGDDLTFAAEYLTAASLTATITYDIWNGLSVFSEYKSTIDGFFQHDQDHARLFYEKSQVAAGIGWRRGAAIDLRLGAGYAFDQQFSTGFDVRDLDSTAKPSDEMLFFVTLRGTF